jgi:transcriptional regulator with XRE-family HTH domain
MSKMHQPKRKGRPPATLPGPGDGSSAAQRLGAKLRERRKQLGLTLEQVCERAGGNISLPALSAYENGAEPSLFRYLRLCQALDRGFLQMLPADIKQALRSEGGSRRGQGALETALSEQ